MVFSLPEVDRVFTNVGVSTEGFVGQSSNYLTELNVTLVPKESRKRSTDEISDIIKKKILQIPGMKVRTSPIGIFGTANQSPIALLVSAPEYEQALRAAQGLADVVRRIPGTSDIRLSSEAGKPEMQIEVDRDKMAGLGLTLNEVGEALRVAFNGDDESRFREGMDQYPIRVVLDRFDRSRTEDIGSLTFASRRGTLVQLNQFASVSMATGPTKLQRQNRNYSVTVNSQAVARPAGSIVADIKLAIAANPLPKGVDVSYLGDEKNRSESFGSLLLALAAAILFVYMIMVALYDSFVYPFVVLFSIPVAVIGAFLALALTMKALNIFTMLGVIMLVGLVGKNAILLVDRTNQMRKEKGLSVHDALVEAAQTRLRPILMTTASMVVGMSPIAFSLSSGSEFKSGLAWALIGGLLSSLFLTLVLVPVVYSIVDGWRFALGRMRLSFGGRKIARGAGESPAAEWQQSKEPSILIHESSGTPTV
jgi:HAE1 family hydrophobic/amphiphilic exporter-1